MHEYSGLYWGMLSQLSYIGEQWFSVTTECRRGRLQFISLDQYFSCE